MRVSAYYYDRTGSTMTKLLPGPRYRERGSATCGSAISWRGVQCNGVVQATNYAATHREGVLEGMSDVVTPDFRKLQAEGKIVNSPMQKVKQTFYGGGVGSLTTWSGCNSGTQTAINTIQCDTEFRYQSGYLYNPIRDSTGKLTLPVLSLLDLASLQKHAGTKALAGVDDSTMQGLVAIGELRKTLATLRNPIKALTDFTVKWRKSKTLRNAISGGPKAVADQYLAYYYGIKPAVKDIESALEAYLRVGITNPRRTSRAKATDTKTQTTTSGGNPGTGFGWNTVETVHTEELIVRAGVLYTVDHLASETAEFGLRLSDTLAAVLELTPWSFLSNYFVNLNELVNALSPRSGVTYEASWNVARLKMVDQWNVIAGGTNQSNTSRRASTEYAGRLIEAVTRIPTSPYQFVGLSAYKSRKILDWSTEKDLAVISLAFQQLSSIHSTLESNIRNAYRVRAR